MKRYSIYQDDHQIWSFDWDSVPVNAHEQVESDLYNFWGYPYYSSTSPVGEVEDYHSLRVMLWKRELEVAE